MKLRSLLVLCMLIPTGCSHQHVFEVPAEGVQEASLTLYDTTTPMERSGPNFVARRSGGDGSGQITLVLGDGRRLNCPIAYVTNREREPHRFAVNEGQCREQ